MRISDWSSDVCSSDLKDVGRPVGILADLPGPKVRAASFGEHGTVLATGDTVRLVEAAPGDVSSAEVVAVALPGAVDALQGGDRIALGDGGVVPVVADRCGSGVIEQVTSGGILRGRHGASLPVDRVELRPPTQSAQPGYGKGW